MSEEYLGVPMLIQNHYSIILPLNKLISRVGFWFLFFCTLMSLFMFFSSFYHQLAIYSRSLWHFGLWLGLLVLCASVALISPELAFLWSSHRCGVHGYVRVPLDLPGTSLCLPSHMVKGPSYDVYIPVMIVPIFVACSGLVLSFAGLSCI